DRRMWDEQMTALAGRYHVIRYDQRGFGKSGEPDVPYSPVADLNAVLDHAGADRAALVGCSLGGSIAIEYTLAHPGRVTGLVLVSASLSGLPFEPVPAYFAALRSGDPPGQLSMGGNWTTSPPAYPRLGDIRAPVLVVAGDRDAEDFVRIARLLADRIPGARLLIMPGADHNVPVRAGSAFTELLAGFLGGLL